MNAIQEYRIVFGTLEEVENQVNQLLSLGWQLVGGALPSIYGGLRYSQTLVRPIPTL